MNTTLGFPSAARAGELAAALRNTTVKAPMSMAIRPVIDIFMRTPLFELTWDLAYSREGARRMADIAA